MAKLLLVLLIGLVFESAGLVCLKKGMAQIGGLETFHAGQLTRVLKSGATNSCILAGVLFEALFFACLLLLMRRSDISFLWPLTGLSFVFATFAAICFLHEEVSVIRWLGVVLTLMGAALISYSEHVKPKSTQPLAAEAAPETAQR